MEQVAQVLDDVAERYSRLDVLINNVGIAGPTAEVEDIDPAEWDKTIAVDLNGHFSLKMNCCLFTLLVRERRCSSIFQIK